AAKETVQYRMPAEEQIQAPVKPEIDLSFLKDTTLLDYSQLKALVGTMKFNQYIVRNPSNMDSLTEEAFAKADLAVLKGMLSIEKQAANTDPASIKKLVEECLPKSIFQDYSVFLKQLAHALKELPATHPNRVAFVEAFQECIVKYPPHVISVFDIS